MMYEGLQMDIFINQMKKLLSSIVVKRSVEAKRYDTASITRAADEYLMVRGGLDEFTSYVNFDVEVYESLGISGALMSAYMEDKEKIPYALRGAIVRAQRQFILSNYVEKNDYYRCLAGLPDMKDKDFLYAPANRYDIPTNVPVHQLNISEISRLQTSGMLAKMIKDNPTKNYLRHLGSDSISYYDARRALNYEILFIGTTNPENIGLDFKKFYAMAREYFMSSLYNPNLQMTYKYYDNFIGFSIIVMAIERLFCSVFKQGITRDFYDTQLIRYLFDSYSIPYLEELTLSQMKLLAKNLNIFLNLKSSNKVIFDIVKIFGFSNIDIYKYFLVKTPKIDSVTKLPIQATKKVLGMDGTMVEKPDYDRMFDLYFQKVNLKADDTSAAMEDKAERVSYHTLVDGDIYWVDDEEVRTKMYEAKYNYIETKYLSMDVIFRLTEIMYEICHTFRMIIDNRDEFAKVTVHLPRISNKNHDLFSVVVFICAAFCKKYRFKGEIPLNPTGITTVLGFNFKRDLPKLAREIEADKNLDNSMIRYLINTGVNNARDVDRIYRNIRDLKNFITSQAIKTTDIDVYHAYQKLYKSILVTEDIDKIYAKSDGVPAKTWGELLENINPELALFLSEIDGSDSANLDEVMRTCLYQIENLSEAFKYLHNAANSNTLFSALIRLITFFKSYTVDFAFAGVRYTFDDRYLNLIKILDEHNMEIHGEFSDNLHALYADVISRAEINLNESASFNMRDVVKSFRYVDSRTHLVLKDSAIKDGNLRTLIEKQVSSYLKFLYTDTLAEYNVKLSKEDRFHIREVARAFRYISAKTKMHIHDNLDDDHLIQNIIGAKSNLNMLYKDGLSEAKSSMEKFDKVVFKEILATMRYVPLKERLKVIDGLMKDKGISNEVLMSVSGYLHMVYGDIISKVSAKSNIQTRVVLGGTDSIDVTIKGKKSKVKLRDKLFIESTISPRTKLNIKTKVKTTYSA